MKSQIWDSKALYKKLPYVQRQALWSWEIIRGKDVEDCSSLLFVVLHFSNSHTLIFFFIRENRRKIVLEFNINKTIRVTDKQISYLQDYYYYLIYWSLVKTKLKHNGKEMSHMYHYITNNQAPQRSFQRHEDQLTRLL